jgi:hypothetical protein
MSRTIRMMLAVATLLVAFAGGAVMAQGGQAKREAHPVLQNSIRQIEAIKDRLQNAPSDFGGHRVAAIEALNHAISELQQAIQFDKK